AVIAEIGLDMARFPTAGHLVSWAKYAPGVKESAGKKKGNNSPGHGNPYPARILGNAAPAARRADTFLRERHRRIAPRPGPPRRPRRPRAPNNAPAHAARPSLAIPPPRYPPPTPPPPPPAPAPPPPRIPPARRRHNHVRQLEALGYTVTLERTA